MATSAAKQLKSVPKAPAAAQAVVDESAEAPPPKKKRGVLTLLLVLLVILGGAGGAGWYFLGGHEPAAPAKGGAKPAPGKSAPVKAPIFVPLETFTVNLQREDSSSQYLQVGLTIKVADERVVDAIKQHMPEIRNRILLLLSSKKPGEISSLEGKQALAGALAAEIAQPLAGTVSKDAIDSVLFTSFVIQ